MKSEECRVLGGIAVLQTGPIAVNTYIIPLGSGIVLVVDPADSNMTGDEGAVANYLKAHGQEPLGIVLTHGHFDHILGIPHLMAFCSCSSSMENGGLKVAISKEDALSLEDDTLSFHKGSLQMMNDRGDGALSVALRRVVEKTKGNITTLNDGDTLDKVFGTGLNSEVMRHLSQWKVLATPGHTAGSVCLYKSTDDGQGFLLSGDTMFYHGWGRTDLGGSERQILHSLNVLRNTIPQDTLVFPGHDRYGFEMRENF